MSSFEFKIGKYQFVIRKLEDGREEEAKNRAKKWIEDCKRVGKQLDSTQAFADIEQLPKI